MYLSIFNPMKKIWPTRAYLCTTPRCLKTLRPPRDARSFFVSRLKQHIISYSNN